MKTFREHLNEEVKIGALASGGIDIEREAVRDEINGILAAIAARPCVTPYNSLNKVRKALAYFSIFLPKRVYLEGKHGVEVWEVNQFGDKMGFTDQGDWIHHVPAKYHLFFHYHLIGSMYYLEAKIVDEKELEERISRTEKMFAEATDAAVRQDLAKAVAPKEPLHDVTSDEKKKGNKEAVSDSEKGLSEERKRTASVADAFLAGKKANQRTLRTDGKTVTYHGNTIASHEGDHVHVTTAGHGHSPSTRGHINGILSRLGSPKLSVRKGQLHHGDNPVGTNDIIKVKKPEKATFGESRMPASVIKHKQRIANMTPEEKAKKFAGKSQEELKAMARRHGFGKDSNEYSKHVKEEQIDEVSKGKAIRAYAAGSTYNYDDEHPKSDAIKSHIVRKFGKKAGEHAERAAYTSLYGRDDRSNRVDQLAHAKPSSEMRKTKSGKIHKQDVGAKKDEIKFRKSMKKFEKQRGPLPEETLDEKLTKKMSAGDVISDFVHSDDPKFKGKSKKERQKMALGAYYGMHPEKSKK